MKQKSWHLNRRQLLKGGGAALALPMLNGMLWGDNKIEKVLPKRLIVTYMAYGTYMPTGKDGITDRTKPHDEWSWWPCKDPGPLSFNKSSAPFKSFKDSITYLQGLDHAGGWHLGGHSSGDVFSTGAEMFVKEKTNNISIDQIAAKVHGHKTRYPSIVLGTEGGTGSYGRSKTLSHLGPGRPIPSMDKPQVIFNHLFQPYAGKSIQEVRAELKREASILDEMLENSKSLRNNLGKEDQIKMDEYLESIRALEKRVQRTSEWTHKPLPKVDKKQFNLQVNKQNPEEYIRCLYDLLFTALQTDSTRFGTFMLESEHSSGTDLWNYATYALGYKGATHDIAHKRPREFSSKWDLWRAEQHAYFLNRLKSTQEADSNMLDNTLVLWGSAHPHASHSAYNYPLQLAGGNKMGIKHGNLHLFSGDKKVPLANMFLSLLHAVDVPVKKFADSTGEMSEILV